MNRLIVRSATDVLQLEEPDYRLKLWVCAWVGSTILDSISMPAIKSFWVIFRIALLALGLVFALGISIAWLCTISTGRVLPGSCPLRGLSIANQIEPCLTCRIMFNLAELGIHIKAVLPHPM